MLALPVWLLGFGELSGQSAVLRVIQTLSAAGRRALAAGLSVPLEPMSGSTSIARAAYASARVSMRLGGPASPIVLAVVPDPESGVGSRAAHLQSPNLQPFSLLRLRPLHPRRNYVLSNRL